MATNSFDLLRSFALSTVVVLSGTTLYGCKEDPPPPPMPDQAASGKARSKVDPQSRAGSTMPRISPATMKAYRVETCYYGALGLLVARDSYNKSLGGAEPGPNKIPTFGDYPEPNVLTPPTSPSGSAAKTASTPPKPKDAPKPGASGGPVAPGMRLPGAAGLDPAGRLAGREPMMAGGRQLPFVRHIRSCSVAKTLKTPAYGELDKAVEEFDKYASELNKALLDANRYYARKQYEKDEFKRAKELHKALTDAFPKLDAQLAALGKAYRDWIGKNKGATEKLDKGGEMAHAAMTEAREVALLLLADEIDKDAVGKAMEKAKAAREALSKHGEEDKKDPSPRVVLPKIDAFLAAAEDAAKAKKKPSVMQIYAVAAAMAEVIEANQRAVAQSLRMQSGGGPGMAPGMPPMRMMKPHVTDPVKTAPAEPHEEEEGE